MQPATSGEIAVIAHYIIDHLHNLDCFATEAPTDDISHQIAVITPNGTRLVVTVASAD